MSDNRVEIKFEHRFSSKSDNGKAFRWLKQHFGSECTDAITNIVRFVYLPVALAEAGASRQQVETEIQRARDYFNEKMMAALGSCSEKASSDGSAPKLSNNDHRAGVIQARNEPATTTNGTNTFPTTAIDPDDDFLELDEDKFMEG